MAVEISQSRRFTRPYDARRDTVSDLIEQVEAVIVAVDENATAANQTAQQALQQGISALQRANHTGTQASSTIIDLAQAILERILATLVEGAGITLTPDLLAGTLEISSSVSGADSFETVSKNLAAENSVIALLPNGDIDTITYASGAVKTFAYDGAGDLQTVTLSGVLPGGIATVKTFVYTLGTLSGITYT